MDLIQRMIYLDSLGNSIPKEKVWNWLNKSENKRSSEFIVNNNKFYYRMVSSKEFTKIIDEDVTDWLYINSDNTELKIIAKIQRGNENLIGKINEFGISTIWILKSDIETLKIKDKPILIWTPYYFNSNIENINYHLIKLITKLQNPNIKLTELVSYKISKELKRRIR